MERNEGIARVIAVVAECLDLEMDEVEADSQLIPDLGADSLDFVDLLFALGEEFGVKMRDKGFDFLARLDVNNPEVVKQGYLTERAAEDLQEFLPDIGDDPESLHISHLFDQITVETLWRVVRSRLDSA